MLAKIQTGYRFGPFRLCPERRELVAGDRPVALKGRAFDLLSVLVRNRDRMVSKDEIFAAVWAGTTVSDNNLTVQMSALRRTLAAHGGDPSMIVNVPGRGYQFVGEVEAETTVAQSGSAVPPEALESSEVLPALAALPPVSRQARVVRLAWPLGASLLLVILLATAISFIQLRNGVSNMPDERLAIAVNDLSAIGARGMNELASAYTDAIVTHPIFFGDIQLFRSGGCRAPARYCLEGAVRRTSREFLLSLVLIERVSGLRVFGGDVSVSGAPTEEDLFVAGRTVLTEIRPALFQAELRLQPKFPRDALDWYVRAQVETVGDNDPLRVTKGIALLGQALEIDHDHKPSRLLLATLLLVRLSLSPVSAGEKGGERVSRLLEPILLAEPRNAIALASKGLLSLELNQPLDAVEKAHLALEIDPRDTTPMSLLASAYIEAGLLNEAADFLKRFPEADDGSEAASLAFATRDYGGVLPAVKRYQQFQSVDIQSSLMSLLCVASEWRLGRYHNARSLLRTTLAALPADFQRVSDLRQSYYELPDQAWDDFVTALDQARSSS